MIRRIWTDADADNKVACCMLEVAFVRKLYFLALFRTLTLTLTLILTQTLTRTLTLTPNPDPNPKPKPQI